MGRDRRGLRLAGRTRAPSPTAACTTSRRSWGTAVTVQAMVFGNLGDDCATGVAFTRDPSTGERRFFGEYLINAQGEDVVAGIRTPQPINDAGKRHRDDTSLEEAMPAAYAELVAHLREAREALPRHAGHRVHHPEGQALDAADAHRQAHRQGDGAHRRRDGEGGADHAPTRRSCASTPDKLDELLAPDARSQGAPSSVLARGLPASPGAAVGKVVFNADDAEALAQKGEQRDPGARRDLARGHPRHEGGAGHPDRARRHDLARGRGRARHGQVLRRRLRRRQRRLRQAAADRAPSTASWSSSSAATCITLDGATGEVFLGAVPMSRARARRRLPAR